MKFDARLARRYARRENGANEVYTQPWLNERRETRRQRARRRRRRVLAAAALASAALAAGIVVLTSGSGSRPHARRFVASTLSPSVHRAKQQAGLQNQDVAVDRVLSYTSYVQLPRGHQRDVALTFDDGPGPYTARVLRVLEALHAPATFFVIGRWARAYPGLVRAEARGGFEIGDHTEDHPPLAALAPRIQAAQVTLGAEAIEAAGAPYPRLLRPPYGSFNQVTLQVLRAAHMLMVLWSADTKDYERPGVARIVYTAVSGAQPGAIVLMHDGGGNRAETIAALPRIINRLRRRGYRLVTVAQLIADDPPSANQRPPTPLSGLG